MKKEETLKPEKKDNMPELRIVDTTHDEGALPIEEEVNPDDVQEETPEEQEPAEEEGKKSSKRAKKTRKDNTKEDDKEKEPKSVLQQLRDFVNEDEDQPFHFDFKAFVGGDGLVRIFTRNWLFITLVVVFTCCYVTSRYLMDGEKIENNALADTLIDRRYKALTAESVLKQHTLSSHVESSLRDSSIHTPTEQAFSLDVNE